MISGECPYTDCNAPLLLPSPSKTEDEGIPQYQRHDCEQCHRPIWTKHSRLDPWSMTEAAFLEAYVIDDEKKEIRKKGTPEAGAVFSPEPPQRVATDWQTPGQDGAIALDTGDPDFDRAFRELGEWMARTLHRDTLPTPETIGALDMEAGQIVLPVIIRAQQIIREYRRVRSEAAKRGFVFCPFCHSAVTPGDNHLCPVTRKAMIAPSVEALEQMDTLKEAMIAHNRKRGLSS